MAPKKILKRTKTRSERYTYDLCTSIDNNLMIYHLKCLNIDSIHKDDEWFCMECEKRGRINKSNSQSEIQLDASQNRGSVVNNRIELDDQSQRSTRMSQTTQSSAQRRAEIELHPEVDVEWVNTQRVSKAIVHQPEVNVEWVNTQRISKAIVHQLEVNVEWVNTQRVANTIGNQSEVDVELVNTQRVAKTIVHQSEVDVQSIPTTVPPIVKRMDGRMSLAEREDFARRFEAILYGETPPLDRTVKTSVGKNERNPSKTHHTKSSSTFAENPQASTLTTFLKSRSIENERPRRIPCPAHDAKQFIFRGRDEREEIPCSNSTFVQSQTNVEGEREQTRCNRSELTTPMYSPTLKWDNFVVSVEPPSIMRKEQPQKPNIQWEDRGKSTEGEGGNKSSKNDQSKSSKGDVHRTREENSGNAKSSFRNNETIMHDDIIHSIRNNDDEQTFDKSTYRHRSRDDQSHHRFEQTFDKSTHHYQSTDDQSHRRVEVNEPRNRSTSINLSVEHQPNTSYASASQMDGFMLSQQIASRHVFDKKTRNFYGVSFDWPIWFKTSISLCDLTNDIISKWKWLTNRNPVKLHDKMIVSRSSEPNRYLNVINRSSYQEIPHMEDDRETSQSSVGSKHQSNQYSVKNDVITNPNPREVELQVSQSYHGRMDGHNSGFRRKNQFQYHRTKQRVIKTDHITHPLVRVRKSYQSMKYTVMCDLAPLDVGMIEFHSDCGTNFEGQYLKRSWKESQRLTEIFWKRFAREYLPTLTRRTKWHKKVEPLSPGDLVLVIDENSPRNTYPKARIVKTIIGSNGQVRRAKVELISGTKSNNEGQITSVKKFELWRSAHKLALLDVASMDGLAIEDRETGGSVGATEFKSNGTAKTNYFDATKSTGSSTSSATVI